MSLISELRSNINDVLGIRDQIGAALKPVAIITRTYTGREIGEGTHTDEVTPVTPSPAIVQFTAESVSVQGGAVKAGDIMLKAVSKQTFPNESDVDCVASAKNIEKFYRVGSAFYTVIGVTEKHFTWRIHLRRRSDQT